TNLLHPLAERPARRASKKTGSFRPVRALLIPLLPCITISLRRLSRAAHGLSFPRGGRERDKAGARLPRSGPHKFSDTAPVPIQSSYIMGGINDQLADDDGTRRTGTSRAGSDPASINSGPDTGSAGLSADDMNAAAARASIASSRLATPPTLPASLPS